MSEKRKAIYAQILTRLEKGVQHSFQYKKITLGLLSFFAIKIEKEYLRKKIADPQTTNSLHFQDTIPQDKIIACPFLVRRIVQNSFCAQKGL